jgi:hypothetical protein
MDRDAITGPLHDPQPDLQKIYSQTRGRPVTRPAASRMTEARNKMICLKNLQRRAHQHVA